jgi:hypothetical protein
LNLIIEKCERIHYYTNVAETLAAMGVYAKDYDWYVSDVETNIGVSELCEHGQWLSGLELARVLSIENLQFIWAVFSAVAPGQRPVVAEDPYADGNPNYWSTRELTPQLPGALFEIACWDSSATILVGLSAEQEAAYRKAYP